MASTMQRSVSHTLNRSTSTPNEERAKATIDSVRLSIRGSLPTRCSNIEKVSSCMIDIDIDALDAEFERLSYDFKSHLAQLRKDPDNPELRQSLISTNQSLSRMKAWSSLIRTTDGLAFLKQNAAEQREREIQKRKYEIDQILKWSKAQSAIDLCFLMDCTGSMRKYVDATKTQIRQLTQTIVQFYGVKPRLAFVGYRDINETLDQLDFTDDENQFEAFLHGVQATGGDDTCEDVFGGLEVVGKLAWSNPNRVLVHVCDAPCHGRQYHDFQGTANDNYLTGDPKQRDLTKLIFDIKRLGVIYCKISLNDTTKKMFDEFEFIFGTIADIQVRDPKDLIQRVIEKTSAIIQSQIQSTISTYHDSERVRSSYTIFTKEPDWKQLESIPIEITEIVPVSELDELFYPLGIRRSAGAMKIAPNPFAKGSLRYAFYGQFSTENSSFDDVVFKELANDFSNDNAFMTYREHLEIQAIAQFLAEQFNAEQQRLFRHAIPIIYVDANLVQQVTNPSKIYQVERRMQHEWRKWNNNSGGVSLNEYSTILQAFSHWTYHVTKARLMVVDLQGVKVERTYLLTDPAVHCDDILRFRRTRTNLGIKGMQQFFRTHVCSEICTKFNLPLMNDWSSDSTSMVSTLATKMCDMTELEATALKDFENIEKSQIETMEVFELC